jgi:hypothetical protein
MKFKVLLLALAATLVVASGAAAKNGGNGKSHAQTTHSQSAANGSKHEAKGHTKKAKVKKPKKHDAAVAEEAGNGLAPDEAVEVEVEEPTAEKTNPAWTCKTRLEERGAEQFVSDYGTNTNGANAFGKCVSGVASGSEEEATEVPAEPGAACEAAAPAPDVVETTEVPAADEESSDTTEVPACEPADGSGTITSPAGDGAGDTTGTVTDTVVDPAVPSADDALLAAARAVKAFAASL